VRLKMTVIVIAALAVGLFIALKWSVGFGVFATFICLMPAGLIVGTQKKQYWM